MEARTRTCPQQFSTLLEFMESHGDLAKPQPGAQGRLRADRLWQELADTLNYVGSCVRKTPDKWKKVWADWKSKTKKKALVIRRDATVTGGPSTRLTLTPFEVRVMRVMGALAVEAHETEDQGFEKPAASPSFDEVIVKHSTSPPPSPEVSPPLSPEPVVSPPASPASIPPPSTSPPSIAPSLHSSPISSHGQNLRTSRIRTLTPFERATSDFVVSDDMRERNDARRIEVEEMRERNDARRIEVEEMRERNVARRIDVEEMRERNEARRIEVEEIRERNEARRIEVAEMRERNESRRIEVEEMRERNEARRLQVEEMREMNEARRIDAGEE